MRGIGLMDGWMYGCTVNEMRRMRGRKFYLSDA